MKGIVLMSYPLHLLWLDEPLRTSGWEATSTRILFESKIFGFFLPTLQRFLIAFFHILLPRYFDYSIKKSPLKILV